MKRVHFKQALNDSDPLLRPTRMFHYNQVYVFPNTLYIKNRGLLLLFLAIHICHVHLL